MLNHFFRMRGFLHIFLKVWIVLRSFFRNRGFFLHIFLEMADFF